MKLALERFDAELLAELPSSANIAPTQPLLALLRADGRLVIDAFRWGLIPSWAHDPKIGNKTFNARAETIAEKPSFRPAFRLRRCAVLVDGFYEWATVGSTRVPHVITVPGAEVFCLAGLWETWKPPEGGPTVRSCTIITTTANAAMQPIHERMPVILDDPARSRWLDPAAPPEQLQALLAPFAGELAIEPTKL